MQGISKSVSFIEDFYVDKKKEVRDNTLELMIKGLNESTKRYQEENKIYYEKIEKQLEEIRCLTKYTLSEQEKQRFTTMSMSDLLAELQKNIDSINNDIDTLIERQGE